MKKFVAIVLTILYLSSASGATVHFHYCMGKLADWGIEYTGNKPCPKCGMDKKTSVSKDGCCKDKSQQLKTDKVQRAEAAAFNFQQTEVIHLGHSFFELPELFGFSASEVYPLNNAPPKDFKTSLFLRNCTFRI